jgi:hypothetical protein
VKFENLFWVFFAIVAASTLYRIIRKGGLKGGLFGARLKSTVSEMELARRGMVKTRLKVHVLEGDTSSPQVGLEIQHSTIGSWNMTPVSLTTSEAESLGEALTRAAVEARR